MKELDIYTLLENIEDIKSIKSKMDKYDSTIEKLTISLSADMSSYILILALLTGIIPYLIFLGIYKIPYFNKFFDNYLDKKFNKRKDSYWYQKVYNEAGYVNKKINKHIENFENELTEKELLIYKSEIFKNELFNHSFERIISNKIDLFLKNNKKEDIIKNKKTLLKLMDSMEENSILFNIAVNRYTKAIREEKSGEFNSKVLNGLDDIENDSFISKNNNLMINKI